MNRTCMEIDAINGEIFLIDWNYNQSDWIYKKQQSSSLVPLARVN